MSVQLREFTLDDYDAVYALWTKSSPGIGIGRSDSREEIAKKVSHDPDLFLVAFEESILVGTVLGGYDGRRGLIYHLAVEPSYQSRGLGTMLMQEIERRLARKGCLRCYLLVKPDATDVLAFYRYLGWDEMPMHLLAKNIA